MLQEGTSPTRVRVVALYFTELSVMLLRHPTKLGEMLSDCGLLLVRGGGETSHKVGGDVE